MAYISCLANDGGIGFITHQDRNKFYLSGHESQVQPHAWIVEDNEYGRAWITRVNGTIITNEEAQKFCDDVVYKSRVFWEDLPDFAKAPAIPNRIKPSKYSLADHYEKHKD